MKPAIAVACALVLACSGSGGAGAASPAVPSDGCSRWTLTRGLTTGSIQVGGVTRTYVISVPSMGTGPVPVAFAFHGRSDHAASFRGWFPGFETSADGPTIFVYPEALVNATSGVTEWDDANGRDVAFFDALLARIEAEACVDRARIFVTGFSYGGFMSNTLGCKRAGVLRAIAPLSGGGPGGGCNGQRVAAFLGAGDTDTLLPMSVDSRDHWAEANGCGASTAATTPSPCVTYSGCAAGFPVVWCQFTGGHVVPTWEPKAVMQFFDGLP